MSLSRDAIRAELEWARSEFHAWVDALTDEDLERPSANPRWTNRQILWHVVFAFRLTVILVPLAMFFSRLPRAVSRAFAAALNATTPLFNVVNRLGPVGGARLASKDAMGRTFDRKLDRLLRWSASLDERQLNRGMDYPRRWDPNSFRDYMTIAMILRYPVLHLRHHRGQIRTA